MDLLLKILFYTGLWSAVFFFSRFVPSKYLKRTSQQDNFVSALHAIILPVLSLIYYLSLDTPLDYDRNLSPFMQEIFYATIGFYIFSSLSQGLSHKTLDPALVFHHVVVSAFFLFMLLVENCPDFLGTIVILKFSGLFYNVHLILKETGDAASLCLSQKWYDYNYYSWIFFRFILGGIFTFFCLYFEYHYQRFPFAERMVCFFGLAMMYYFAVFWMVQIIKRRRIKAKASALSVSR